MLDIKYIRENKDFVQTNSLNKGYDVSIEELLKIDDNRRSLTARVDELRKKRNDLSTQNNGQRPSEQSIFEVKQIKEQLLKLEFELEESETNFNNLIKQVPNVALDIVPVGASEDDNIVIKTSNEPNNSLKNPKNHAQIAEERGWLDKERAAKVAGSRFAYIKGDLVFLQFALIQFALDIVTNRQTLREILEYNDLGHISDEPFTPILPPYFIRTELYDAMDRLEPRDDRYKLDQEELWLQGSAEHVLGSMHADEILPENKLPIRYIGYATSFRKEAGSYGKDTEGLFRMHQFDKLELESLSATECGHDEHKFMVAIQEYLLTKLNLPYRVIQKSTFDIGKPNAQGIDMEVWLPGQGKYRETHTADYMTDYQARRLKTRVRRLDGELELVHTNDATALALGRIMIAIIENGQTDEAKVILPKALVPYMANKIMI